MRDHVFFGSIVRVFRVWSGLWCIVSGFHSLFSALCPLPNSSASGYRPCFQHCGLCPKNIFGSDCVGLLFFVLSIVAFAQKHRLSRQPEGRPCFQQCGLRLKKRAWPRRLRVVCLGAGGHQGLDFLPNRLSRRPDGRPCFQQCGLCPKEKNVPGRAMA